MFLFSGFFRLKFTRTCKIFNPNVKLVSSNYYSIINCSRSDATPLEQAVCSMYIVYIIINISYLEKISISTAIKRLHMPFRRIFSLILVWFLEFYVFYPFASFLIPQRRQPVARMPTFSRYDIGILLYRSISILNVVSDEKSGFELAWRRNECTSQTHFLYILFI